MDRSQEIKLRIKESVDLVALIEGYVALRRRGRTMVGLCPFHDEKSPSFTVYPDTQHFNCYGCGKHGDVITWVQEREGVDFPEAMEILGDRVGVSTEGVFRRSNPEAAARRRAEPKIHEALAVVRDWLREQLDTRHGGAAVAYLDERGLLPAVDSFHIGYHPDRRADGKDAPSLYRFAQQRDLPLKALAAAGLLRRNDRGDVREPFGGRLMFPIEDDRGRVVGFGGRVLPRAEEAARQRDDGFKPPKYVNSPESPFFNKRRVLFGFRQVKNAAVHKVVVMEGYTDVIACHLAGFEGAVATLGTALTTDHAKMLSRWADQGVTLFFDGDRAGRSAAERAYRELAGTDLDLRVALAPEGTDPADTLLGGDDETAGKAAFEGLLEGARDAIDVWFRLLRDRFDFQKPVHLQRAAEECARVLSGLSDEVRRRATCDIMARHLGVPRDTLSRKIRPERGAPPPDEPDFIELPMQESRSRSPLASADLDVLAVVLAEPSLLPRLEEVSFPDSSLASLCDHIRKGVAAGMSAREPLARFLFSELGQQSELSGVLARCVERSGNIDKPEDFLTQLLRGRSVFVARSSAQDLRRQAQQALARGDREEADRLTRLYLEESRRRVSPQAAD